MKKVYDVIMKLRATSGSNAKRDILLANKGNLELKLFLYRVYEPSISYYQTSIPIVPRSMMGEDVELSVDVLDEMIEKLAERELTGDAAKAWLGELYANLTEDWMRVLVTMIIDRDIKCGVKEKTINKVWPRLITDEPYMGCVLPKKTDIKSWPWERGIDSEIKYDGMYANMVIHKNQAKNAVVSRNGSIFLVDLFKEILDSLTEVANDMRRNFPALDKEDYIVFNGELEMLDQEGKLLPRAEGNGKFNSLLQSGEIPHGYTPQYKVWDFVPGSGFEAKQFNMPRSKRKAALVLPFLFEKPRVELGKITTVFSYDAAIKLFKEARSLGLEGTIIKHPDGPWEDGKSIYQVKMKAEVEVELRMVKLNPGKGKNAATFGSVTTESEDGLLEVDVSGFTEEMNQWIFDNWEYCKGKIMSVMTNDLTKPKKAGEKYSMFLPRFQEIREDKREANTLQEIMDMFKSVISDGDEE